MGVRVPPGRPIIFMTYKRFNLFATCFDKRGRVISSGQNDYKKSHPLMKSLSVQLGEHPDKIYLHAEVQALLKAGDRNVHSVLVQRFNAKGEPALAKPCKVCSKALKMYGVKVVRYTSEDGIIEERP